MPFHPPASARASVRALLSILALARALPACVEPVPDESTPYADASTSSLDAVDASRDPDASTAGPRPAHAPREPGSSGSARFRCDSPVRGPYHPRAYGRAEAHGDDFKMGRLPCADCHGSQLEGCNFAGGCDLCHRGREAWRTDCIYCHGGEDNPSGAPPGDLDRKKAPAQASFLAHSVHIAGSRHGEYDCTECHVKPESVSSPGHTLDDSPGHAEVSFAAGLSKDASYDGQGACSNVYCHGNRQENGSVRHDQTLTDCNGCHAFDDAEGLSGRHDPHVNGGFLVVLGLVEPVQCFECHGEVIDSERNLVGLSLHVNGEVNLTVTDQGITYDGKSCTGSCHGAPHTRLSTW